MTEIKLTKRYPQSRTEDIVDVYMRGWNDALDAVQNGKFIINDDRKTESSSEKPNNCDEPQTYVINPQEPTNDDKCFECDDFFTCGGQCNKIEDEPQTMYYPQVDGITPSVIVKDEPQTDCAWR